MPLGRHASVAVHQLEQLRGEPLGHGAERQAGEVVAHVARALEQESQDVHPEVRGELDESGEVGLGAGAQGRILERLDARTDDRRGQERVTCVEQGEGQLAAVRPATNTRTRPATTRSSEHALSAKRSPCRR